VVDVVLTPVLVFAGAFIVVLVAESLHLLRVRRVATLVFGPARQPALWVRTLPVLRAGAVGALAWGLVTLMLLEPKKHSATEDQVLRDGEYKHVMMVLDVSPSMRLVDAGPKSEQSRMERARDVLESFFKRVPLDQYRISVVATYNGAKPVVIDTRDIEVVRNVLGDLPMHFAFRSGKTKIFEGLEEAARIAKPWNPNSTTLILVSDGDTVPAQGMPKMPASISDVVVIGVGDALAGKFIDGRQSRQDVSTLRQIATRLGGVFHNGNVKHLSSNLIGDLTAGGQVGALEKLGRREYALLATGIGSALLALLPLLLHFFGTSWRPGSGLGVRRASRLFARLRTDPLPGIRTGS
jgi:Ca-activated chloride channel family protein